MVLTPNLCVSARGLLRWRQLDLAETAGLARPTVARFEMGEQLDDETIARIQSALEKAGIEFLNGGSPGVRLKPGFSA